MVVEISKEIDGMYGAATTMNSSSEIQQTKNGTRNTGQQATDTCRFAQEDGRAE